MGVSVTLCHLGSHPGGNDVCLFPSYVRISVYAVTRQNGPEKAVKRQDKTAPIKKYAGGAFRLHISNTQNDPPSEADALLCDYKLFSQFSMKVLWYSCAFRLGCWLEEDTSKAAVRSSLAR